MRNQFSSLVHDYVFAHHLQKLDLGSCMRLISSTCLLHLNDHFRYFCFLDVDLLPLEDVDRICRSWRHSGAAFCSFRTRGFFDRVPHDLIAAEFCLSGGIDLKFDDEEADKLEEHLSGSAAPAAAARCCTSSV